VGFKGVRISRWIGRGGERERVRGRGEREKYRERITSEYKVIFVQPRNSMSVDNYSNLYASMIIA
jgi:hypothetical protein